MIKLGKTIANHLLQIKAIKLEPTTPFTWASGWKSPIYCDNRKTLSYPEIRAFIKEQFCHLIKTHYGRIDAIVGVATGGIAIGALVAEELGLPFAYVRSSAKSHGLTNQIEGDLQPKQTVVVIEDLISTGMSSLNAVEALRQANYNVKGMCAIFTYNFKISEDNFRKANCDLITLSNYDIMIEEALEAGYVKESDLETLRNWRVNPDTWGK